MTPDPDRLSVDFNGRRGALFGLALRTGILTVLTLGLYRFWMKTRLRRYYWSSIRPGGHPLEYVGDPVEKLTGFLIAVVILAFYIGIVNLLLMFASFAIFHGNVAAYVLSFLGILPIWFYAQYRARRYVLARTRWRGVRFGVDRGAWGYAGRAMMNWAITILTLGLLWPRMTFSLEKYKTDRTWFGSVQFHQGGRWWMLYRAAIPLILSIFALVGVIVWIFGPDLISPPSLEDMANGDFDQVIGFQRPERLLWFLPAVAFFVYALVHYSVMSSRILANHKSAGGMSLQARLRAPRVFGIYVFGGLIAYLTLVFGIFLVVLLAIQVFGWETVGNMAGVSGNDMLSDLPRWLGLGLVGIGYFSVFILWSVMSHVFITFPLMRHYATTLTLLAPGMLRAVGQRDLDQMAEAEGFAEALDLGGAI